MNVLHDAAMLRHSEAPVPSGERRRWKAFPAAVEKERKKYFDVKFGMTAVRVLPGEHYVSGDRTEMLVTVLGSCIAACIRDPLIGIGGMNHFMLPESRDGSLDATGGGMRYGNHAMEILINDLIGRGAVRERLEIKLFGGAHVARGLTPIGERNCAFIDRFLRAESLQAVARDLGGNNPRRIHFFPATGKVRRLLLRRIEDRQLLDREEAYQTSLNKAPFAGSVELFE